MPHTREIIAKENAQPPFFVGLDLGGTNIKFGVVDDLGQSLSYLTVPTEVERGPDDAARRMGEVIHEGIRRARLVPGDVARVGLGSPGTMDIPAGKLVDLVSVLRRQHQAGLDVMRILGQHQSAQHAERDVEGARPARRLLDREPDDVEVVVLVVGRAPAQEPPARLPAAAQRAVDLPPWRALPTAWAERTNPARRHAALVLHPEFPQPGATRGDGAAAIGQRGGAPGIDIAHRYDATDVRIVADDARMWIEALDVQCQSALDELILFAPWLQLPGLEAVLAELPLLSPVPTLRELTNLMPRLAPELDPAAVDDVVAAARWMAAY